MIQKNKRPIPKEFCIQNLVAASPTEIPKEEPKVIFTAETSYKKSQRNESHLHNGPTSNSKNMLAPAVAAMLLMDVLK